MILTDDIGYWMKEKLQKDKTNLCKGLKILATELGYFKPQSKRKKKKKSNTLYLLSVLQ